MPTSAVPDHYGAATVFTLGDHAFEFTILERVILNAHSEVLFTRHQRRSFRNRPAFENAVEFEPQVVMQRSRRMLLNDVRAAHRTFGDSMPTWSATRDTLWFGCSTKVALAAICP